MCGEQHVHLYSVTIANHHQRDPVTGLASVSPGPKGGGSPT